MKSLGQVDATLHELHGWISKSNICFKESSVTNGDIYEFGCWSGQSLQGIAISASQNNIKYKNVHAFDSFEGLPEETEGVKKAEAWYKGNFSSQDYFNTKDNDEIKEAIVNRSGFDTINFVEGFYCDTLNQKTYDSNEFNPAILVHIDVDLYKSCLEVLDFLFKYKILIKGSMIMYDDFGGIPKFDSGEDLYGEKLAHLEICNKYNVEYEILGKELFGICKILDYKDAP